jgi:DNA-binding LacI/PurR family transcriptional regulator
LTSLRWKPQVGPRFAATVGRTSPVDLIALTWSNGVICASHRLGPQLLGTLAEMRLSLPGQLSFITFGDSDWARAYRPAVAVIRFDRYREARRATYEVLVALGGRPRWRTRPPA